jgi:CPA2 family monovalent cation:H+ antiporter-2
MHGAHDFLTSLALVLCVAAVTSVVFQHLRQPVVFGYLLAGMIVGPHIPVPLVADQETVETLAELGVILLLFGLGLEFSLRKLLAVLPTAGIVAVIQSAAMVWMGYEIGRLFGWTTLESVYAGAAIAISSTTIIVKAVAEQGASGRFVQIVFGILIIEDLIAILLLAILTTISAGGGLTASSLALTAGRLAAFLAGLVVIGLLTVPRLIRAVVRLGRPETTLVTAVGICFAAALLALGFGYSVALGAFVAGSLVAESGEAEAIERLTQPVRDMFGAIFFVSVGMMIDPALVAAHWQAVVVLTVVVIVGKIVAVSVGSFLVGNGIRTSVQSGMSLAQIGEFSFIIAGIGLASGATRDFIYPVAVAVSAITTLTTPWLIRSSGGAASLVERKLPHPVQTFAALYGSWIERLKRAPHRERSRNRVRRLAQLVAADAVVLAALALGLAVDRRPVTAFVERVSGIGATGAEAAVLAAAGLIALPFAVGLLRTVRALGLTLARVALPPRQDRRVDLAAAPRRALAVTLQLAIVTIVGLPILAAAQPFLRPAHGAVLLAVVLAVLGAAFWRRASDLQEHTRAGAEAIVALLREQMAPEASATGGGMHVASPAEPLARAREALPGLGEPSLVRVRAGDFGAGRTLREIDLRGVTGATILSIVRENEEVSLPIGRDRLLAGDALALAGTTEAIDAATLLLREGHRRVTEP